MNYPKYLINSFAILGVISLIFFACAAADNDSDVSDDTNNPPVLVTGRYQISSYMKDSGSRYMDILDTETGVVKHYKNPYTTDGDFVLYTTTVTQ